MAQDPKAVDAKVRALRGTALQFVGKEVDALPGVLHDGEDLRAIGSGLIDSKSNCLSSPINACSFCIKARILKSNPFLPNKLENAFSIKAFSATLWTSHWRGMS